ncbi:hypothetical protein GCM10017776_49820 [Streptomyces griseoluteus]|nr:hypothetical protein GCM10017776_49820 [Streptomyces griseoluteus]
MRVPSGKDPSSPAAQGATAAADGTGASAVTATRQSEAGTEAHVEQRGRDNDRAEDNRMNT